MTADEIIARLGLQPHPEGGHYRETFRAPDSGRAAPSTAIYFLLKAGERSHWHRVDADEIWHHYAGAPLELSLSDDGRSVRHLRLGSDFEHRRAAAGRRAARRLAGRPLARQLDPGRLHRGAGLRLRRLRARAAGLGTRP